MGIALLAGAAGAGCASIQSRAPRALVGHQTVLASAESMSDDMEGGLGGPSWGFFPSPSGLGPVPSGLAPVVNHVTTTEPVVFVTIDDGWTKDPAALAVLAEHHIPVSAFVIGAVARADPGFWRALVAQGGAVEDHTDTHPPLAGRPPEVQQAEICAPVDEDQRLFGRRPTLFRPPYGSMDGATVVGASHCGLSAVVLWDATFLRGRLQRATPGPLQAGDIILLHWIPGLAADLQELAGILDQAGLHGALLEDYLRPPARGF